jgi:HEPN domain-containing protein
MPSDPKVVTAYLDDTETELVAVRRLLEDPPNRFAAFHVQQAAEKLIKAVRLARGMNATADHNLVALIEELAEEDPWRAKLEPLGPLMAYATAYRYPTPAGRLKPGPPAAELVKWIELIKALVTEARTALLTRSG